MNNRVKASVNELKDDLTSFFQELVRIKSITGDEEEVAKCIQNKMMELEYDDIIVDKIGNIIGVIGSGPIKVLYDSHIDTVEVCDASEWSFDPFGAEISNGSVYGRGTVDTKGAVASTVYAGGLIKKLGLDAGKTIYISTSVMEEDCDAEPLTRVMEDNDITPDFVVIGEPSNLKLAVGHKGRAAIKITLKGVSAHGSAPEKGVNPVYGMNTVIKRVQELGQKFIDTDGDKGSLALTKIECTTASINAIPNDCCIYLDRRLTLTEDKEFITNEMNAIVAGTGATWEIHDAKGITWKNKEITVHSFLPAWEIDVNHHLVSSAKKTYKDLADEEQIVFKWNFSTNGIASAGKLGIPTIGFGPGDEKYAHMKDEHCPISDLVTACEFYTLLVENI